MFDPPTHSDGSSTTLARALDRRVAVHSALLTRSPAVAGGAGGPIRVRPATVADAGALDALAQLDSARAPAEPRLLAEIDGRAIAAIGVLDRRVVADPWVPTAAAVEALQAAAAELRGPERRRRWTTRLLRRG
jgi:hypothetical protein